MSRLVIAVPVLFTNEAPIVEMRLALRTWPRARSVELVLVPKLYVSPPEDDPLPALYVLSAFEPVSENVHPVGRILEVPADVLLLSESKFSVNGVPIAVRLAAD